MVLYSVTVFIAAFLLFQVQPVLAKMILPWFGGSSGVWTTCMLFFQSALLLGYIYAHWLETRVPRRRRLLVHLLLLAASLALLPVIPGDGWKAQSAADPSWRILGLLAATVGLPYFLLSSTSPLLQSWYARTHTGALPYRLFALSNLASLAALLSYPVLVEPALSAPAQARIWSAAYTGFVLLSGLIVLRNRVATNHLSAGPPEAAPAPAWRIRLLWIALPAAASVLLLATTNYLTQDVAAIPFLWVPPLAAYLLSFVLCFEAPRLYCRPVFLALLAPALAAAGFMLSVERSTFGVLDTVAAAAAALFVFSMVCHGELVRVKPHPAHLTAFYLMLSLGGALGGVFVGLAAPRAFSGYYEFPIGLALCGALALAAVRRDPPPPLRRTPRAGYALAAALVAYCCWMAVIVWKDFHSYRLVARNFYGQLRVEDIRPNDGFGPRRWLLHGSTYHGEQFLDARLRRKPASYFCPATGVGMLLEAAGPGPRRIGIIGLGCGTLAAYGRAGDMFRFYEINPQVIEVARTQFTYLRDTAARIQLVVGDGRLSLEREPAQGFDLLVIDAFSSDAIPVHLIAREAFRTYLRHLKPGGSLAINISNTYLDLRPVLERVARAFRRQARYYSFVPDDGDPVCSETDWVLLTDPSSPPAPEGGSPIAPWPGFRMWTDDYSNLFQIIR